MALSSNSSSLTISAVDDNLGYKFTSVQLKSVCQRIAKAYISMHYVQAQPVCGHKVKTYHEKDSQLLETELHAFANAAASGPQF
jgi:hypothetical protein